MLVLKDMQGHYKSNQIELEISIDNNGEIFIINFKEKTNFRISKYDFFGSVLVIRDEPFSNGYGLLDQSDRLVFCKLKNKIEATPIEIFEMQKVH